MVTERYAQMCANLGIRQAQGLRFSYVQHAIALRVPNAGDTLAVQAGPAGLAEVRDARSPALPPPVRTSSRPGALQR